MSFNISFLRAFPTTAVTPGISANFFGDACAAHPVTYTAASGFAPIRRLTICLDFLSASPVTEQVLIIHTSYGLPDSFPVPISKKLTSKFFSRSVAANASLSY